jgi:hypothetical protein
MPIHNHIKYIQLMHIKNTIKCNNTSEIHIILFSMKVKPFFKCKTPFRFKFKKKSNLNKTKNTFYTYELICVAKKHLNR